MLLPLAAYGPTFVVVSSVLLYISRGAMRRPRSHGFSRFFAWECILGLIWINLPVWGADPLALSQRVAMVLLMASICLPLYAFWLLRRFGQPGEARQDEALIGFEKTTTLVTAGAFRYIRHPMYTAFWLWALAQAILLPNWLAGFAGLIGFGCLYAFRVPREERMMAEAFGEEWRVYAARTPRVVPWGVLQAK